MSIRLRNLSFALGVSALALIPAAIAATVCEAMDSYKKKNYVQANKLFEKAVKENPKDWKAHYYMGNCLYAMGKFNSAVYQYELAAGMTRNPQQIHLCQMASYKAESSGMKSRISISNMRAAADSAKYNREVQVAARKFQILNQAEKQAQAIKSQAEQRIIAEKESSNMRALDGNGGMHLDITRDHFQGINREAQSQMDYVRDLAKNKADNIL